MNTDMQVSIIGLGLIGGSLAKALKHKLNIKNLYALDKNSNYIDVAIKENIIVNGFTELSKEILESDIIFICTDINYSKAYLKDLYNKVKDTCIITDVGSTKCEILEFVETLDNPPIFIGGHPMTGKETSGYFSSTDTLFENAYYILTPSKNTPENSLHTLFEIIEGIGGIGVEVNKEDHDKITALISHVPHVIAYALVKLASNYETNDDKIKRFSAGGFKDLTRIASSSPDLWKGIVLSNKKYVLHILNEYISILNNLSTEISLHNSDEVLRFFKESKTFRDKLQSRRNSLIEPRHEIGIDIPDIPGGLGDITTLLGNNNINIKNISVESNREFEPGCISITFEDQIGVTSSIDILQKHHYTVYLR